ncbi:MAG: MmcQ/YjbR family DNA-binding protein [Gammaproteobacteria bacterium]|jgi:predicted DNA-binding protein (MmcQ/YjbR family)|nr:MmcQ/YjbR family DNA-binding protein [Gammaproteobacteria bacterium]MBP6052536.1 MmcQ/YjbR family DNA-binding protein [Pseudomonadales bacterium]MBK6583095.1 MmcQ/YjbR family DNA-binding protein [Gammaproteobacteria bacterium]MBK7168023.1 MmcQ/YjbR family DNA-binding protein [Gammaproteobacteria bacterium]MBK7730036.1 MmcQ/YjbR family DNA-binding protein [Gammaproteobacteria bacterium]
MDYDAARNYLLTRPEAFEDYPFGPEVAVYKIRRRMFALLVTRDGNSRMNLKCDPLEAQFLRDMFESVKAGYHMNKTHWNTVILDGSIPRGELERMIDRSYGLVVRRLRKADRVALETLYGSEAIYR